MISKTKAMLIIKNICFNSSGNATKYPVTKAAIAANVIVNPVFMLDLILSIKGASCLLSILVVNNMSVSMLYPIINKNETIPAADNLIPKISITAKAAKISVKAAEITARPGINVLNEKNTTIDININENNNAINNPL